MVLGRVGGDVWVFGISEVVIFGSLGLMHR